MYMFVDAGLFTGREGSWLPPSVLAEAWVRFFPCWNGLVNTTGCCCVTKFWASASRGHRWVGWYFVHKLHGYLTFCFSVLPPPALSVGFLSPLPFFHCFFLLSNYWLVFGFIDCTLCTTDVWVGGAAKQVVWLATVCCIENCCNLFDNWSMEFPCVEPTIPSTCGPDFCLAFSRMDRGASGKIS